MVLLTALYLLIQNIALSVEMGRKVGMLVYTRRSIKALRRAKLEPDGVESICLYVKGSGNSWFLICACYRSPGKCKISDFLSSCVLAADKKYTKRKEVMYIYSTASEE